MHSHEIEALLRRPAPEEPSVLPQLVLPMHEGLLRVRGRIEPRGGGAKPGFSRMRLALALLLLVLAMIAAIASGAIRLDRLPNPFDPNAPFGARGVTLDVPKGWVRVAAVDPSNDQGGWTALIVSNKGVDGCSNDEVGTQTMPVAVPSGDGYVVPEDDQTGAIYPLEDRIFDCVIGKPMAPGEIRLVVSLGYPQKIGVGPIEAFDATVWFGPDAIPGDHFYVSTAADGWDRVIDGLPAKLIVETTSIVPGAEEVRTWGVYQPGSVGQLWFVRMTLRGPDLVTLRVQADRVAQSLRFDVKPPALDTAQRDAALARAIDALDREFREFRGSRILGCFLRTAGERVVVLDHGPAGPLFEPVEVTCRTTVETTPLVLWRATLIVEWEAGNGVPAGQWGWELFFDGGTSGGGQGQLFDNEAVAFPGAGGELPPPLDGPLVIPVGSVVRVLPPGINQAQAMIQDLYQDPNPTIGDRIVYEAQAGARFYVVDLPPIVHHGTPWYRVEWQHGTSYPSEFVWLPATNDNRPLVEVVDLACPSDLGGLLAVTDLLDMQPAERMLCFGDTELTIDPVTVVLAEPWAGDEMQGTPEWLAKNTLWRVFGSGGQDGVDGALPVAISPSLGDSLPTGTWLSIRGHFDDPASPTCRREPPETWGDYLETPEMQVLLCRENFVITGFEPTSAP
jgi:hypothetical protein